MGPRRPPSRADPSTPAAPPVPPGPFCRVAPAHLAVLQRRGRWGLEALSIPGGLARRERPPLPAVPGPLPRPLAPGCRLRPLSHAVRAAQESRSRRVTPDPRSRRCRPLAHEVLTGPSDRRDRGAPRRPAGPLRPVRQADRAYRGRVSLCLRGRPQTHWVFAARLCPCPFRTKPATAGQLSAAVIQQDTPDCTGCAAMVLPQVVQDNAPAPLAGRTPGWTVRIRGSEPAGGHPRPSPDLMLGGSATWRLCGWNPQLLQTVQEVGQRYWRGRLQRRCYPWRH